MMFAFWVSLAVLFLVVILFLKKRGSKYPPGPYGLPVLGYIPFLRADVHLQFSEIAQKYGEVFSLSLGSENVVVLNGASSVREAYAKPEFLGRPPHSAFSLLGSQSPFFLDDLQMWQEQRRFVVHSMKDLGLGRSKIEQNIQDEIGHFLDVLSRHQSRPVDPLPSLTPSVSNNICSLVLGRRYGDEERAMLDSALDGVTRVIAQTSSHIFFAWIRHFPFLLKWLGYEKGVRAYKMLDDFFILKVEEHRKTLDPKNIRDFIDSFLVEAEDRKAKDPNASSSFTDEVLLGNISDIFGAGTEPVRTALSWCIYSMAAHGDMQRRVREELEREIGTDRRPETADRKRMPYTRAVIQEVMRWKTTLPLNLLRYTTTDTEVGGYRIPKGTTIMANLWAVHHDPESWSNPEEFVPERFLDGAKNPNFMPFSVGKRACPGETMATIEIFLYFVSILQKFEIRMPEGVAPLFEAELTITYRPKPYKVRFIPRD